MTLNQPLTFRICPHCDWDIASNDPHTRAECEAVFVQLVDQKRREHAALWDKLQQVRASWDRATQKGLLLGIIAGVPIYEYAKPLEAQHE